MHRCNLTLTEHISGTQLCSAPQVKRNPTSNCCINSRHCSSACPSCCLLVFLHTNIDCFNFLRHLQPFREFAEPFPRIKELSCISPCPAVDESRCRNLQNSSSASPDVPWSVPTVKALWSHPKGRTESLQGSEEEKQDTHQSMLCNNIGIWKKPWTARRLWAATQLKVFTLGCREG